MDKKLLQNSPRPYALVLLCGLLAGAVTRLTDLLPAGGLWGFSSIATLYGFWVLSVTVIVLLSSGPLCAGACSFLYLFAMTLSFYGLQPLLGRLLPQWFQAEFKTSLFLLYTALSACAGVGAFVLGFWERGPWLGASLAALPVGALLAEAAGTGVYLFTRSMFLFQFLMDLAGALALGAWFLRRLEKKGAFCAFAALAGAAAFLVVYLPSLPHQ